MTATAVSLREGARHHDGRFGEHRRDEPDIDLHVDARSADPSDWDDTPLSKIPLDSRISVLVPFPFREIEATVIGNGAARGSRLVVDDEGRFFEVKGQRNRVKYIRVVIADEEQFALRSRCLELASKAEMVANLTFVESNATTTLHRTDCGNTAPSDRFYQKLDSVRAVRQAIDGGVLDQLVSKCPCMTGR